MPRRLEQLCIKLGHTFNDDDLLHTALTHRSVQAENNERLEFLGDSILNFIIAKALYQRCADMNEGPMSRLRANLVKEETLAVIAKFFFAG